MQDKLVNTLSLNITKENTPGTHELYQLLINYYQILGLNYCFIFKE